MGKLLKFILIFVTIIVLIVGVPIVILYITIEDSTDNAPVELYSDSISVDNQLDSLMLRFSENNENDFYLSFSEDDLNLLIFALIKENFNDQYYSSDDNKYIETYKIPKNYFLIGGREAKFKHVYSEINEDGLLLMVTMDAFGIKTNLNLGFSFESDEGTYKITLNKLGLGGLNLMSGLGKTLLKPVMSMIGFTEDEINANIEERNLPIVFKIDDFSFSFKKEDIGTLIKSQLGEDVTDFEGITALVDLISSSENNLLDIGLFKVNDEANFGLKLSLSEIENSQGDKDKFASDIGKVDDGFNEEVFIANKTQTFLISNLSGKEQKIRFTNLDFNRIIYDNTDGYKGFGFENPAIGADADLFVVKGILFEFKKVSLDIIFVVSINGVESKIVLTGDVASSSDEKEVRIKLRENLLLQDLEVSSEFILDILSEQMDSFGGITYDSGTSSFIISSSTFTDFMDIGGGETLLNVEKIRVYDGGIEVIVETAGLLFDGLVTNLTEDLKDALGDGTINTSGLDNNDPGVADLAATLDEINNILNTPGGEITDELADELINNFNNLSYENQMLFMEEIEDDLLSGGLGSLYDDLFGN